MRRSIRFTRTANEQLNKLENSPADAAIFDQVRKAIGFLEIDPHHPSLHTHEFTSLTGINGEKIFEAYAQNNTPGAYRIFWHYGPDEVENNQRTPTITVLAITPHP